MSVKVPAMIAFILCDGKIRRSRCVNTHPHRFVLYAPEEPSDFSDLLPSMSVVLIVYPKRIVDALELDSQICSLSLVGGENASRPIRTVGGRTYGRRIECLVVKLQSDFDPLRRWYLRGVRGRGAVARVRRSGLARRRVCEDYKAGLIPFEPPFCANGYFSGSKWIS